MTFGLYSGVDSVEHLVNHMECSTVYYEVVTILMILYNFKGKSLSVNTDS